MRGDKASVILITGMPGSGKTTLAEYIGREGYLIINMGDSVRELALTWGLEPTAQNLGLIAERIRRMEGEAAIARRCIGRIKERALDRVLVDGIRSLEEVDAFKEDFEVTLLAVHASPKTRFKRILKRGRKDDTLSWEDFLRRDRRELALGLGSAIAMADHMIVNEGPLGNLERSAKRFVKALKRDPPIIGGSEWH
ncbi:flagellar hook-basal body complex protein FliE [Candidatus Bathyarchaeota archaeon]|nr:flagellar hook-basal body complex protein FliE [Candidatus Bathyarchaeota archaeon]